jgi:hypothetical protein
MKTPAIAAALSGLVTSVLVFCVAAASSYVHYRYQLHLCAQWDGDRDFCEGLAGASFLIFLGLGSLLSFIAALVAAYINYRRASRLRGATASARL